MNFVTKHFRTTFTKLALANYTVFWLSFVTPVTVHQLVVSPAVNKVYVRCQKEIRIPDKKELTKHCKNLSNQELITLTEMNTVTFVFSYLLMSSIIFNVYIYLNIKK
jgi:hypothetical protein